MICAISFHCVKNMRKCGRSVELIGIQKSGRNLTPQAHSILLGLWMSPGRQGRQICRRCGDQGKSCPIVATFPDVYGHSHEASFWEFGTDFLGGLRGRPLEVIGEPALWPGASKRALPPHAGLLRDQLESVGIQDIVGVFNHRNICSMFVLC